MPVWLGAGALLALAAASGVAEHRRRNRRDPDRVGLVPWPMVQLLALVGAVVLVSLALNG